MKKLLVLLVLMATTFTVVYAEKNINEPAAVAVEECIIRGEANPTTGGPYQYFVPLNFCPGTGGCNPCSTCYSWSTSGTASTFVSNSNTVSVTFTGSGPYTISCSYTLNGVIYTCTKSGSI